MEAILSNNVLVLNRLWQAVNICTVKRAFMLLYQGHAQVVEPASGSFQTMTFSQWHSFSHGYEGADVVSTISFKIRVPKVILLLFFDRMPKKEVKFTRHNIFERDHNICQYCGLKFDRKDLNLDHVIPRDRGGETSWENIVCSCVPCNSRKGNRTPHEAGPETSAQAAPAQVETDAAPPVQQSPRRIVESLRRFGLLECRIDRLTTACLTGASWWFNATNGEVAL